MDEQQHNALELPKGLYEPVLRQPMELDFLLGQELSLCFHDLDGSHVFKTCYGDICKAVNALLAGGVRCGTHSAERVAPAIRRT